MKQIIRLLIVLSVFVQLAYSLNDLNSEWERFKKENGKIYSHKEEEMKRREIWTQNYEYIKEHNKEHALGKHTFKLGMNKFGDLTNKEFKETFLGKFTKNEHIRSAKFRKAKHAIPDSFDWRTKGCVEAVRDQGMCNDLYAFGATESISGVFCAKTGKLIDLSTQQIVDCSGSFGNMGCDGGDICQTYNYIKSVGGIESSGDYPNASGAETCKFNPADIAVKISGYLEIPNGNETILTQAIATIGPFSVGINAGLTSFQFYESGIYYDPACDATIDFLILLVGYGSASGQDYYIGKNSWGTSWGMNGYIELARNRNNNCGIASYANYPLL